MGNFFKSLSSVAILILLVFLCFAFAMSTSEINYEKGSTKTVLVENPSATFCEEKGGDYIEIEEHNKSVVGFCNFKDGSSCNALDFFIGKCKEITSNNHEREFNIVQTLKKECQSSSDCGATEEYVNNSDCSHEMLCLEGHCNVTCPNLK